MDLDKTEMQLKDRNTMYHDMVKILKKTGLADFIQAEAERMIEGYAGVGVSIDEMLRRGKFIGVDRKKSKKDYLKRGRFYLATVGESRKTWAVFYVNPVDWFQKDSIGLVYIGWSSLLTMLENPEENPMSIGIKGWNNGLSDIAAVEDYQGLIELADAIAEATEEEENYDFFREEGYTFYELPNVQPTPQLGVFNWWW